MKPSYNAISLSFTVLDQIIIVILKCEMRNLFEV